MKDIIVAAIISSDGIINEPDVAIGDAWRAILNVGEADGVREGQDFIIYTLGDEIIDPADGSSLGRYEIVRGRGEVVHIQDKLCTVRSAETRQVPANALALAVSQSTMMRTVAAPFSMLRVGDRARRV